MVREKEEEKEEEGGGEERKERGNAGAFVNTRKEESAKLASRNAGKCNKTVIADWPSAI